MQRGNWGMMDKWSDFSMPFVQVLVIVALMLSIVALWKFINHKH
jgi:hypothetical protein